ncbi:MAG: hypothetical protein Fur002_17480 [Anaerolineales bacterium]
MTKKISPMEQDVSAIEAHLAGALKPIPAPSHFHQRLRARVRFPTQAELAARLGNWRRLFFVLGGVMSGMLLLITLARMFYYLTGRSPKG